MPFLFQIARGSASECAACLDLLAAQRCCSDSAVARGKSILEEIVKVLFAILEQSGRRIAEDSVVYGKRANEEEEVEED
jgi:hypothetical protein